MRIITIGAHMLGCTILGLMAQSTAPGIIIYDPGHFGEPKELERINKPTLGSIMLEACEVPMSAYGDILADYNHPPRNGVYKNKFKSAHYCRPRPYKARSNC